MDNSSGKAPFHFGTTNYPKVSKIISVVSLGLSRSAFGALLLRFGMLWWSRVLSSWFLLTFGGLRGVPGCSFCSSYIINNEVC